MTTIAMERNKKRSAVCSSSICKYPKTAPPSLLEPMFLLYVNSPEKYTAIFKNTGK
jgi:hypothetical protein